MCTSLDIATVSFVMSSTVLPLKVANNTTKVFSVQTRIKKQDVTLQT